MQPTKVYAENTETPTPPAPLDPLTGPIQWTVLGRNFTMDAHRGEEIDPTDTSKLRDQAKHWGDLRLMYQWRKLVIFQNMDSVLLGAVAEIRNRPTQETIDSLDDRLIQIHGEWLQIENSLVAYALRLTTLAEVNFVKSIPSVEKLRIIAIQDRLNGHDMINHLREIANYETQMRILRDQEENKAEERAALVEEAKKAAEARKVADAEEAAKAASEKDLSPDELPAEPAPEPVPGYTPKGKFPKKPRFCR